MLYPNISTTTVDYALGIESSYMWFSTGGVDRGFKWYANTTNIMLSNTTALYVGANVLANSASSVIGYDTGSGGANTQLTSRTTGVTLNKGTGSITLVSAAGTTAWQAFTVTNSLVAATDVIHVAQKSGTDKYVTQVTAVSAGSFEISFATTGGTTTEQPVFNYVVIKGVAA